MLYRSNFLAAYSSNKIAVVTQEYVVPKADAAPQMQKLVTFEKSDFLFHLERYRQYYASAVRALNDTSQCFMFVQYNELHMSSLLQRVIAFLGLDPCKKLSSFTVKMNTSNIIDRFVNREDVWNCLDEIDCREWAHESFIEWQ